MSDKELVITSLRKAERRIRTNRLLGELALSLSLFLVFPLAFKIWDLFSPFRGRTVAAVIAVWLMALVSYSIWRARQKGTLEQAAAEIDTRAGLHDELKSAYWFIIHPKASEWVDVQLRRAAQRAASLNIDGLYPRSIPRTSYLAVALLVVLVGLNFMPLSWNHNWFLMEAAPAFRLNDAERNLAGRIQEMLEKAKQQKNSALAGRIQEVLKQLQDGTITATEAMKQLQDLRKQLTEDAANTDAIEKSLDKIAQAFESSDKLKDAGEALKDRDMQAAAEEMKNVADKIDNATPDELKQMQNTLEEAADNGQDLDELSDTLKKAANDLEKKNKTAAKESINEASELLKDLGQKMEDHKVANAASQELQDLQQMLQERQQAGNEKTGEEPKKKEQGANAGNDGDNKGQKEQQASDGESGDQPGLGQPTRHSGDAKAAARSDTPTTLDVKLEQETISGTYETEQKPDDIDETSKEERSKLDYRNVPSELTPSQRDLLNPEHIPLEYRNLIKDYFEAIKPRSEKR